MISTLAEQGTTTPRATSYFARIRSAGTNIGTVSRIKNINPSAGDKTGDATKRRPKPRRRKDRPGVTVASRRHIGRILYP